MKNGPTNYGVERTHLKAHKNKTQFSNAPRKRGLRERFFLFQKSDFASFHKNNFQFFPFSFSPSSSDHTIHCWWAFNKLDSHSTHNVFLQKEKKIKKMWFHCSSADYSPAAALKASSAEFPREADGNFMRLILIYFPSSWSSSCLSSSWCTSPRPADHCSPPTLSSPLSS